jgi:hypothetical protein
MKTNYFALMIFALVLIFIGGNISAGIFIIPTGGYSIAMLSGILTAIGSIIGLYITLRISLLRI